MRKSIVTHIEDLVRSGKIKGNKVTMSFGNGISATINRDGDYVFIIAGEKNRFVGKRILL